MKKLFFVLYACLCVGLWSCSNDDEPTVPNEKQDVVVSFEHYCPLKMDKVKN